MNLNKTILKLIALVLFTGSLLLSQTPSKPAIMAHYMPWYQAPAVHGYWGWHWTMNHYSPDKFYPSGHRQIASQFYPLTGPYDSDDKNILEYQTLLMKIAGIDGVLADWYGMENYNDYGIINESTKKLFSAVQKSKLSFGIVYEDQTVKNLVAGGKVSASGTLEYGKTVMKYLQDTWFNQGEYLKLNNRPLLMVFGPQYFKLASDWSTMFTGLRVAPMFYTEDNMLGTVSAGAYPWPPMGRSVGGILSQSSLNDYLNQFYKKAASWSNVVTSAFPGFYDIYKDAGVGESYGYLDPLNGETFKSTLNQAIQHKPDVMQLVTWNDYGEGTIIEPTSEFGNQYLEIVQTAKVSLDPSFVFKKEDLLMPMRIYKARLQYAGNSSVNLALDNAFDLLIALKPAEALVVLDSLDKTTGIKSATDEIPDSFSLDQNYPNPFNPSTIISYTIAAEKQVKLRVFDSLGNEITTLVDKYQSKGNYRVQFNGANLSSGVYYYKLDAGDFSAVKKLILIK